MESFRFKALAIPSLLVFLALTLSATPTGTLSIGITPGGGVLGSATTIDWYNPVGGGFGDFTTGSTTINWSGGVLTSSTNPYGRILDLTVTNGSSVPNFIQFYTNATLPTPPGNGTLQALPTFDLVSTGPPVALSCTGVTAFNVSCSPTITSPPAPFPYQSPFVLTYRQGVTGNFTDISLAVTLLGRDATGSQTWSGGFTAQLANVTPADIQNFINAGQTINLTSYSSNFNASSVPEPATYAFLGSGLLALGFAGRRRFRKQ